MCTRDLDWEKSKGYRETILQLIEVYKTHPLLWDRNHQHYKTKHLRQVAYMRMLEVYKQFDPEANLNVIRSKIEIIRNGYHRELKKVLRYNNGNDSDEEYKPTLFYYHQMHFLRHQIKSKPHDIKQERTCEDDQESLSSYLEANQSFMSTEFLSIPDGEDSGNSGSSSETSRIKKQKNHTTSLYNNSEESASRRQSLREETEEDWEILGKAVGIQLKNVDKQQSAIAYKLIADIVYFARLEKLTEKSGILLSTDCE